MVTVHLTTFSVAANLISKYFLKGYEFVLKLPECFLFDVNSVGNVLKYRSLYKLYAFWVLYTYILATKNESMIF